MDQKPKRTISDLRGPRNSSQALPAQPVRAAKPRPAIKNPVEPKSTPAKAIDKPQPKASNQLVTKPRHHRWLTLLVILVILVVLAAAGLAYYWFIYRT